jgi:uncharacterized protein (DUF924 family)
MAAPGNEAGRIDARATTLLQFWFGLGADAAALKKAWFGKDPALDAEIRARFLPLYEQAAAGALQDWQGDARSGLALVLALDQLPRNMFRGTPRAFATDAMALEAARHALEQGHDRGRAPLERLFLYLPFEHAESLEEQLRCCELMAPLAEFAETADAHLWAVKHCDVIRRFGRFPHRNPILGRASTPEEAAYLHEPGSGF